MSGPSKKKKARKPKQTVATESVVASVVAGSAGVVAAPMTNALRRSYYKRISGKKPTKKQLRRLRKAENRLLKIGVTGVVVDNAGTRPDGLPVGSSGFKDPANLVTIEPSNEPVFLRDLDLEKTAVLVNENGVHEFVISEGDNVDSHRARIRREAKKVSATVHTTVNRLAGTAHDRLIVTIS